MTPANRAATAQKTNTVDAGAFKAAQPVDRLASFEVYGMARNLFDAFWTDSEVLGRDFRGRELAKQQVRSLDSICANIEEGFGRGFGKEYPHYLKIARGEARESLGRFERCGHLLSEKVVHERIAILNRIIGGLSRTITTLENKKAK